MFWDEAYIFAQAEGLPPSREGRVAREEKKKGLKGGSHLTHFFLFAEMVPEVGHHEGSFQGGLH